MFVSGMKSVFIVILTMVVIGCTPNGTKSSESGSAYEAYSRLGFEYLQAGDTSNAKFAFNRSLELKSGYAQAYNGLALTFQLEGDDQLAEDYFRKATNLSPSSAMLHNNFGAFLFSKGRFQEACVELARATEDPFYNSRAQAFENLGRCYQNIARDDAAKHAFKRALQVSSSGRPISLVELSDINLKEGNLVEAEAYYKSFLEFVESRKFEHYAKSLWVGIRISRQTANYNRAAAYALILKNLYPDSVEYQQYKESAR
ncbi:type IV pilus biogenesis/stability protein PilW [Neptuniibacter sp.]|uniref:type IV pilus biogenesis/stability protein PilW n=1 Tax=Neptuniibacter sp. TaxID=1962643 RepID=UPI003B5BC333